MESRSGGGASRHIVSVTGDDPFAGVPYRVKEAGVDWLTATCNHSERRERFDEYGYTLLAIAHDLGEKPKPWRMSGFEGMACRGVAVGHRDDTSLIRLSGPTAFAHWRKVVELSTNCSRIDLQVTIADVDNTAGLILAHHAEALAFVSSWTKPPTVDLRLSNRSSPTLYLNRRVSDRFGRVYDKHDESGMDHYRGCVRYEWQFNNDAGYWMSQTIAGLVGAESSGIGYVANQNRTRGLTHTWATTPGCQLTCPRNRGSDDRRLEWLRKQCAPAIADLIERGRLAEVVSALGLSAVVQLDHRLYKRPSNRKEKDRWDGIE